MKLRELARVQRSLVVGTAALGLSTKPVLRVKGTLLVGSDLKAALWWRVAEPDVVDEETGLQNQRPRLMVALIEINSDAAFSAQFRRDQLPIDLARAASIRFYYN